MRSSAMDAIPVATRAARWRRPRATIAIAARNFRRNFASAPGTKRFAKTYARAAGSTIRFLFRADDGHHHLCGRGADRHRARRRNHHRKLNCTPRGLRNLRSRALLCACFVRSRLWRAARVLQSRDGEARGAAALFAHISLRLRVAAGASRIFFARSRFCA